MQPSSNKYRPADEAPQYEINVFVDAMDEGSGSGGGVANFLTGHVVYNGEKLRFEAVAYGRIGGQNVSPILPDETLKRLRELDLDIEAFTGQLQRKLVEGEITVLIPEGMVPPSLEEDQSR